jgi:hypothetical protein
MGAASEHELISRELLNALNHAAELESELHEAFQTSGATSLVNTARMLTMLRAVIAIGSFQFLKPSFSSKPGGTDP